MENVAIYIIYVSMCVYRRCNLDRGLHNLIMFIQKDKIKNKIAIYIYINKSQLCIIYMAILFLILCLFE